MYAGIIATHLSAPYSIRVTAEDVAAVLGQGTLLAVHSQDKQSILFSIFTECTDKQIVLATRESGGNDATIRALNDEITLRGVMGSPHIDRIAELCRT